LERVLGSRDGILAAFRIALDGVVVEADAVVVLDVETKVRLEKMEKPEILKVGGART
jgi:hypothetical protein